MIKIKEETLRQNKKLQSFGLKNPAKDLSDEDKEILNMQLKQSDNLKQTTLLDTK